MTGSGARSVVCQSATSFEINESRQSIRSSLTLELAIHFLGHPPEMGIISVLTSLILREVLKGFFIK